MGPSLDWREEARVWERYLYDISACSSSRKMDAHNLHVSSPGLADVLARQDVRLLSCVCSAYVLCFTNARQDPSLCYSLVPVKSIDLVVYLHRTTFVLETDWLWMHQAGGVF